MDSTDNATDRGSLIEKLHAFDFSGPVKVNIIIEEDEDEISEVSARDITSDLEKRCPNVLEKNESIQTEDGFPEDVLNKSRLKSDLQLKSNDAIYVATDKTIKENNILATDAKLDRSKNLKRKLDEDITPNFHVNRTTEMFNATDSGLLESIVQENNNVNKEMTCITNLLKNVSEHLIAILDTYIKYIQLREINSTRTELVKTHYLNVKFHLFNMSFCTVDNIILPQENNQFFIEKFLGDTVKLAQNKYSLENQVRPLFNELLEWSKRKRNKKSMYIIQQNQDNPFLRQQLQLPPKPLNNPGVYNVNSFEISRNVILHPKPVAVPTNNKDDSPENLNRLENTTHNLRSPQMFANAADLPRQPGYTNRNVNIQGQISTSQLNIVTNKNSSLPDSDNYREHRIQSVPAALQRKINKTNQNFRSPVIHQTRGQDKVSNHATKYDFHTTNNIDNSKSVVFTSGPPDRQVSIMVEQSLLQTCGMNNTVSSVVPTQSIKNKPQKRLPSYVQAISHLESNIVSVMRMNQEYQYNIDQNNLMNGHTVLNNSHLQSNVTQDYQRTAAAVSMPPWQRNPLDCSSGVFVAQQVTTQPQPLQIQTDQQTDQQNPDMTRSLSTDSGFMSPLQFNNSSETEKDEVEQNLLNLPMITHITSLHPQATMIVEGQCCICGTSTRKKCVGCYNNYYCSNNCQRIDWPGHKLMCKTQPSYHTYK